MPQPRKTASPWRADCGASTVGASWFVLILLLTLFCFVWYLDSTSTVQNSTLERYRLEKQFAARRDRTEYRKAQLKALTELIGPRSAVPTLPGAVEESGLNVTRVKNVKAFADELVNYSQPMFDRGTESAKHKPDFYLKRLLDEDSMVPPALPVTGLEPYDEEAYKNASDKKTAGAAIMNDVRRLFTTPFGGGNSDANNKRDGEAAIKFGDLRSQWSSLYDAIARNVTGEDADAEIKAINAARSIGTGDAWAPTITLTDIVQQIAIKYADLKLDTERLRAVWEIANGGVEAPADAEWNDLRRAARVMQTGDKAGWDQKLAATRQSEREALKTALGNAFGAAGVSDDQVDALVAARTAIQSAELTISLLGGEARQADDGITAEPFTPLSDPERTALEAARREFTERDAELRSIEQQLGWTEGQERIGGRLDAHVNRFAQIDRYAQIANFFSEKHGDDETYSYSQEGYRAYLTERANALKSGFERTLSDLRSESVAFDERYAAGFAARTGLAADLYTDPNGRTITAVGGGAKDTAEAYKLPFGTDRGPADLDTVLNAGIGDLSKVVEWAQAETAALAARRSSEVEPAISESQKKVRDRGQRLADLLVSDAIETVFPNIAKGVVLQAPAAPLMPVRSSTAAPAAVAFIDLDAGDNLRLGMTFYVYEPLLLGGKLTKALATVDRVGAEGQPSRVRLSYLKGIDSLTNAVVRGDLLENSVFQPTYRRNVVVIAPEGESYSAQAVQDLLGNLNFTFQRDINENTDMVILTGSRRDSLRAMAPTEDGEAGDEKPWFQDQAMFQEAERRGLSVFFFEDDVRVRVPSAYNATGGAR